jgi:hypothetical protein
MTGTTINFPILGLQTERFWIQVGVGVLFRLRVPPSVEADLAAIYDPHSLYG